jgi:hypothetical protein
MANKTKEQREEESWAERSWRIFSKCSTRHVLAVQGLKAIQERTADPEARRIKEPSVMGGSYAILNLHGGMNQHLQDCGYRIIQAVANARAGHLVG